MPILYTCPRNVSASNAFVRRSANISSVCWLMNNRDASLLHNTHYIMGLSLECALNWNTVWGLSSTRFSILNKKKCHRLHNGIHKTHPYQSRKKKEKDLHKIIAFKRDFYFRESFTRLYKKGDSPWTEGAMGIHHLQVRNGAQEQSQIGRNDSDWL